MRALRPRRWVVVAGVSLAAATAWLLAQGTQGAEIANVLALPVAVVGLLVALARARAGVQSAEQLLSASRRLARDVLDQEGGMLNRLLADTGEPVPAELSFAQPALIYWRDDGGGRRGTLSDIEGYYRSLDRGRLVVLGEPGAGKTVLAITLVRDLAAAVRNAPDDAHPVPLVPVRLSLPSFNPGDDLDTVAAEVIAARLDGWLIQYLVTVFGLPGKLAHALVTEGRILPVLDGLDEMDIDDTRPRRAAAVIRALNHPSASGLRPIVITCRTSRYQQLSRPPHSAESTRPAGPEASANADRREVVQDATVVGVEPLTVQRVVDYLTYRFPDPSDPTRIEPWWGPVVGQLMAGRSGDPLVAALSSPLRLFLTVTSYRHDTSRPNELTRLDTAGQIDDYLFARLIPAALEQHPPTSREYTVETVTRWLTTLARHLSWQGTHGGSPSDVELHQLWPAAGSHAPRYIAAALMTTVAMTPCLAFAVLDGGSNFVMRIVVGAAAVTGAAAWRASRHAVDLRRLDLGALRTSAGRQRIRRLFESKSKLGFYTACAVGSLIALPSAFAGIDLVKGTVEEILVAIWAAITVGCVFGCGFGVVGGLAGALATLPPAMDRPSRLVRQGLVHLAAVTVAVGPLIGLLMGMMGFPFLTDEGWQHALVLVVKMLVLVPMLGLPVGFMFVAKSPWPRYLVATMILARRGDLPRRPAVFLDWAYRAGLMRLSGIAVQFRHREFQTWLATRGQPTVMRPRLPTLSTRV